MGFRFSLQGRAVQFQRVQDLPRTWEALRQDRREGEGAAWAKRTVYF